MRHGWMGVVFVLAACTGKPAPKHPDPVPNIDTGERDTDDPVIDTGTLPGCHRWDPVSEKGWVRTYAISYLGEVGTETHTGEGVTTFGGVGGLEPAFAHRQVLVTTSHYRDVRVFSQCDLNLTGLFRVGFEGTWTDSWLGVPDVTATYNGPWRLALAPQEMGIIGTSWNWAYELELTDNNLRLANVPTTGTFIDGSFGPLTVAAGEFGSAWHVSGTYTRDQRPVQAYGVVTGVVSGTTDAWYADGIGLIKEIIIEEGTLIYERELSSYSGLR